MATTKTIDIRTAIPGPRSAEILARKERVIANAKSIVLPIVAQEGRGATLTDVDGNVFIDFTGGVGCLNVGHAHPRVIEAVTEQLARFTHTDFTVVPYEAYIELAERLLERAPFSGPAKAVFFNAGTEAVENAVKFARLSTKRPAVIAFEGAFHGRTLLAMTLTSRPHPYKAGMGPLAPEVYRAPFPAGLPRPRCPHRARRAAAALRHAGGGRAGGGDHRRAGPGRRRLSAGRTRVHGGAAVDLRRARDLPDRRRGADGLRAHRQAVRDRALRRRARPDHRRQVDRSRAAALGRARQGGDHGRGARRRRRRHVRRQPGRPGRGARRPRRDRRGRALRARRRDRRDAARPDARLAGALPGRSATCAGWARCSRSSSSPTARRSSPRPSSPRP